MELNHSFDELQDMIETLTETLREDSLIYFQFMFQRFQIQVNQMFRIRKHLYNLLRFNELIPRHEIQDVVPSLEFHFKVFKCSGLEQIPFSNAKHNAEHLTNQSCMRLGFFNS